MKTYIKLIILALIIASSCSISHAQDLEVAGKVIVGSASSVSSSDQNVIRLNNGTLAVRKYNIGNYVHGGIVFWVDESGEHGMVCSLNNYSATWGPTKNTTHAQRNGIYAGLMNTERIIISQGVNSYAADICALLDDGSYGDWYLPSYEELEMLQPHLSIINVAAVLQGGSELLEERYWSSNESSDDNASAKWMHQSIYINAPKTAGFYVRPIRSF